MDFFQRVIALLNALHYGVDKRVASEQKSDKGSDVNSFF